MSTTHTPGRILFREGGEANQHTMLTDGGRWWLALLANGEMTTERQRANFRRLAACWNACEGISTEALETGPTMLEAHQREQDRADMAQRELEDLQVHRKALAARMECQSVVIPACAEHGGTLSLSLTLPWRCIHCGGPRGAPVWATSWDGSQQLAVHTWANPCGHTELYSEVRSWAAANLKGVAPPLRAITRCPDNGCSAEADPQPGAPYQTKCSKCGDTVPF
ncbi:hypothetical protein A4F85_04680 [Delftia sp. GW456-R20]|uniref:hypothetical protein n=1 Tax=Delftia sp. GW456-R20 TaxID=1827145 RepID=UPI0007AE4484|nr:hypothetical protein [Delftia sp. GW456-R20]KZK32014.1 hypothetical protein A4F85_04680 [Delftia sp. GW456-R20]